MSTPMQYPTTQLPDSKAFVVGGQYTVDGYLVTVTGLSFDEVKETKYNPDGSFRCEIVYSRRRKASLDMEALTDKDGTDLVAGGKITINAIVWKIEGAPVTYSKAPTMVKLDVIEIAEMLGVVTEHT